MNIAIYTIALNEEANAKQFCDTVKDADVILVGDTGSEDRTREILTDHGVYVAKLHVSPWRFDLPRNSVLSMVPECDLCIALDLDETLCADWRNLVENNWRPGLHTRLRFRYVHNYTNQGDWGTVGLKDFAHARNDYMWRHCVHEQLYYVGPGNEHICQLEDLVVEHKQERKNRNYLPLLELEAHEPGTTPRHLFWLGREYTYHQKWAAASETLERFLSMPDTWRVERCHAMQLIGQAKASLRLEDAAVGWYLQACHEAPEEREPWIAAGKYYQDHNKWAQAYGMFSQALEIMSRPEHYLVSESAWNEDPYDMAALAAFKLGLPDRAQQHLAIAIKINPDNERLKHSARVVGLQL